VNETMTGRERIVAALTGRTPDRVPRDYGALPGFVRNHPGAIERIRAQYPPDVGDCGWRMPPGTVQGDPYAVGTYVDEWGCVFENVHGGIIGQVKHPLVAAWSDIDQVRPPWHLLEQGFEDVARACTTGPGFTLSPWPVQPFERLQFLRGTETLFKDLLHQPAGLLKLRDIVHEFNCAWVERWCRTPVDAVFLADDWGTQHALLISPRLWRAFFKPLYADYTRRIKAAGKFVYMHSDGFIRDILDDLIEIGVDAINAQVTCMDLAELQRRFAGRITFWGQMDRQHMLCFGTVAEARQAVHDFWRNLAGPGGSRVVCQMHIEPTARPENIMAVLEEFAALRPGSV